MVQLCSLSDFYIMERIRSGEWIPSLDTGRVYSTRKKGFLSFNGTKHRYRSQGGILLSHIIWIAANGPVPYGMHIDHINGDESDNRLCNLRLMSHSENLLMSRATLSYSQAEEIRRRYAEGNITCNKLAKEYGADRSVIQKIVANKTYIHPIDTSGVSEETRKELVEYYKKGGKLDTARKVFKIQQAVIRQVLEEELNKEAKMRHNEAEAAEAAQEELAEKTAVEAEALSEQTEVKL